MPATTLEPPTTQTAVTATDQLKGHLVTDTPESHREVATRHLGSVAIIAYNTGSVEQMSDNAAIVNKLRQKYQAERAKNIQEGWRLHFMFDANNKQHYTMINQYLAAQQVIDETLHFKIGEEKDNDDVHDPNLVTVYVGSLEDSQKYAAKFEKELTDIMTPLSQYMVAQDVPMTDKALVWGRFSVYRSQSFEIGNPNRFAQTGPNGVPYMMFHAMKQPKPTDEEVVQETSARLSAIFGDFFDAHDTYAQLLAAKRALIKGI